MPKVGNSDKKPRKDEGKKASKAANATAGKRKAANSGTTQRKSADKTSGSAAGEASGSAISKGCQLDIVFRLMSGEWTPHILWVLSNNGPTRHGELRRRVEGISSKVMTDRLRMLEAEGIVFRHYEPTIPPEVTYGLTELGAELDQALRSMENIAEHWQPSP